MIFTVGRSVVGDNGTAYETLVSNQEFERNTAISAVNEIVNIIFVLFICILMIYVSIVYRMYIYCGLCRPTNQGRRSPRKACAWCGAINGPDANSTITAPIAIVLKDIVLCLFDIIRIFDKNNIKIKRI